MRCQTVRVTPNPNPNPNPNWRIGVVKAEGCKVEDLLPSDFSMECFECETKATVRDYMIGSRSRSNCLQCHKSMAFGFEIATFHRAIAPDAEKLKAKAKARAAAKKQGSVGKRKGIPVDNTGINPGKPLPENGACKHYRKSFKWFRFACCGRAFACDTCHDLKTEDGHDAMWAKRSNMISSNPLIEPLVQQKRETTLASC